MTQWHTDIHKRKKSGGKKGEHRKKTRAEVGRDMVYCLVGEPERISIRTRGGGSKQVLKSDRFANLYDPATGKTIRTEILGVRSNPANSDFERRGVITKGAIIETRHGDAKVTSRPGSDGVINAVLIQSSSASRA
ncbi:MAG: 30S ribosomal protein S8e [Nitrososphaerota archaeon]|nr:30S ribosomal protein S8e [Candidatus Calditenuaceae archaeon]MDW8073360.1 30S ribosomal protein S8e [Nitrososphaerota archaeon]